MGALIAILGRVLLIMFVVRMISSVLFGTGRPRRRGYTWTSGGGRPGGGPAGPNPGGGPANGPRPPAERAGGTLVRDPQCGTYIPQGTAVRATINGAALLFCSDTCRDAYAAAHRTSAAS